MGKPTPSLPKLSVNLSSFVFVSLRSPRRGNVRIAWGMISVHKLLGLTSALKQQPSKWVFDSAKQTWSKVFDVNFGYNAFAHSSLVQAGKQTALPFAERCLEQPSLLTHGFLFLMARWAYLKHQVRSGTKQQLAFNSARKCVS